MFEPKMSLVQWENEYLTHFTLARINRLTEGPHWETFIQLN